jgi:hypothetical protein
MMKLKFIYTLSVTLFCLMAALPGCDDETNADQSCRGTMEILCEKACECSNPQGDCFYYYDESSSSSERGNCVESEVFFYCGNAETDPIDMDFNECSTALKQSSCEAIDGDWTALLLPKACSALIKFDK